jgi:hypothetical protein
MVQQASVSESMDIDQKPLIVDHHHDSDSGLGSSVASSTIEHTARRSRASTKSTASTYSTITSSASSLGATPRTQHFLSKDAIRHIKKQIIQPILDEDLLKEFHPLIEDIPHRIGARFISNLRDLEKTLFFLAPDFASTPKSFLKFCETTIECLHTTVDYLCERDQRLPADRPYTNNYFLDLVEQIRRYAEIMARTRAKQASGEALDEMDYSPDEEVAIEGGLSKNGKPAELVRKKNGQVIPLSERSALDDAKGSPSSSKRPLTEDDEMDDEVLRSMARRRKSDKPGDVMHPCAVCDKEFKRPCDLTKHEKTHSRPWKCPEAKCRYHEQGWPTEKERDRHVNDKHSKAPTMYRCQFPPCTYSSKRESNCKQHMEKAHDWQYVRSKSNGRKKSENAGSSNRTSSEPLTPFMATPLSATHNNFSSPESPFMPSPSVQPNNDYGFNTGFSSYTPGPSSENLFTAYDTRRDSLTTAGSAMTYSSSNFSPAQPFNSAFEEAICTPEDLQFNNQDFFNDTTMNFFSSAPAQQPTPAMSVNGEYDFNNLSTGLNTSAQQHLSTNALPNVTLYSPHLDNMHFDEALGGEEMGFGRDFTLFGNNNNTDLANAAAANWFPETNFDNIGGQFGLGY